MGLTRRYLALSVLAALTLPGVAVGIGCSLTLNPPGSGPDAGGEGSTGEAGGDDGGPGPTDGPSPGDGSLVVDAGACSKDSDCQSAAAPAGACVTSAKCDPTWHVCMLDACSVAACSVAVCNETAKACSVPTTYGYSAASFQVNYGGVGGFGPRHAIAAVWPFVFIVTTNGVVAYNVVDPTNTTPPLVPVQGLPFLPASATAVGRRVYFVRGVEGNGPMTYREAIGWVDVPQNPFVTSFTATTAWVGTEATGLADVFSNALDGLYLVYGTGNLDPTIDVHPPIDSSTLLNPVPNAGLAAGAGLAAATGKRLVAYRWDGTTQLPNFALVNNAGTPSAQTTTPEQTLGAYGPLAGQAYFASGDDGTVLWTSAVLDLLDGGGNDGINTARLTWTLSSATQANFDTTAHVDLQTFSPPVGGLAVGPPAWIDADTVLALSAAGSLTTNQTAVQVAKKGPPAVLLPGARIILSVGPGAVGVAASNGFGYVLQQNDPMNLTAAVSIFAPACAEPQDH